MELAGTIANATEIRLDGAKYTIFYNAYFVKINNILI